MIPQQLAYRGIGLALVGTVVATAGMSRETLDDRVFGAILLLGPPLLLIPLVGLAERWSTALLAGFGVALAQAVGFAVGTGFQAANTPLCQTCGTCCEGAAMGMFLGAPFLSGLAVVWLPAGSGLVRGIAAAARWVATRIRPYGNRSRSSSG